MCKRNVQTGCTGYVHIAAMRMMENYLFLWCFFLQFIKLSPVDVMRLSLGAWWPEGRSSSSVSQFLPSCSWSACQMAAEWKDGYRGDLSPWLFLQLCFCSVWGRCPAERGGQTLRCAQLSARLSAELCSPDLWRYCTTLRCTESIHFIWPLNRKFQDCWWDPEFPQLSQMVQSLPGFLDLCLNVCSPSQVLGDVLHRGTWSCSPSPQGSRWSWEECRAAAVSSWSLQSAL